MGRRKNMVNYAFGLIDRISSFYCDKGLIMSGVNKVILIGNLTKEVETRFLPNGGAVSNITVATSEKWKDKQTGEQKEKAEFHRVVMFGKLAEIAGEYLKKGSKVYIEGQLQTRKWQNQQGQDQYTTEIVVQGFNGTMQMLDSRGGNGAQAGGFNQQAPQQSGGFNQQAAPQQQSGGFQQQQTPARQATHQAMQANAQQQGGFQQHPKVNPQEPTMDFDDSIPF